MNIRPPMGKQPQPKKIKINFTNFEPSESESGKYSFRDFSGSFRFRIEGQLSAIIPYVQKHYQRATKEKSGKLFAEKLYF